MDLIENFLDISWWSCHEDLENSNSFVENAFNPIYLKNLLPKTSFNVKTHKVWLQCLKRHMAEEKEKSIFPPFSEMQCSCNNVCKKTLFSNMICFGFSFPCLHTM